MNAKHFMTLLGVAALLAACGGGGGGVAAGGGDTPTVDGGVPPEVLASADAFTRYLAARAQDDAGEPMAMDGVVPPTSETDEPLPVTR